MNDTCEVYCYDEEKVNRVRKKIDETKTDDAAHLYKAFSDATRMKIAFALCTERELCVCDAANIIGSSLATASHHLRTLKKMGLVTCRREGKLVFYSLRDDRIKQWILMTFTLLEGGEQCE